MYKETKPPCYGCTKRNSHCHSTCPDYLSWKEERQDMLKEHRKAMDVERNLRGAEIEKYCKIRQAKKNKRSFGR